MCSGLRQCLAQYVSQLSKSCPVDCNEAGKQGYSVSASAVNKLRDLASTGNIERLVQ